MFRFLSRLIFIIGLASATSLDDSLTAGELVIDFESAEIGKPTQIYTAQDVVFELAHEPKKSKAKGRVMFFPHSGDDHKGILNAMADEAIPLRIKLPKPATKAVLTLWGSTTSAAVIEAFDRDGNLLKQDQRDQVPVRKSPEEQVPYFTVTIESSGIASLQISGAQPGGYVALDELRLVFEESN